MNTQRQYRGVQNGLVHEYTVIHTFKDCYDAIKKHKHSKNNSCTGILFDHIIHAGDRLACYLALFVISMLCHGSSPDPRIPLPKGQWINLQNDHSQ